MLREAIDKLSELRERTLENRRYLDSESLEKELAQLEEKSSSADFWNSQEAAQKTLRRIKQISGLISPWNSLLKETSENLELAELLEAENTSEERTEVKELSRLADELTQKLEQLELQSMLSEEYDSNNCYLYIHPGAGGTESCDWAQMLLRMYARWAEIRGFKVTEEDIQPGDEAGVKSATLYIEGEYAYGYLKAENGVHRLVRISPFDANKRRHTSFASVFSSPEVDEDIELEIKESDLRIDRYRSTGCGGQGVNTTDSAIRITHLPTRTVVTCQNERSQLKNLASAMKVLRSRLYQMKLDEREKEMASIEAGKREIAWGSQIRSYVFQPYTMVKDHRTDYETGNIQAMMNGELLDDFIDAWLKSRMKTAKKG
ncbi:peptide chain release factor 2 [Candidatus Sumerlaeota bacterium]|nr:peptide chain release factor 2 [Candidatus Sumerlaeota bacterium]